MKKFKIFAPAILMAAVLAFISGCSDNISDVSVGKTGTIEMEGKRTMNASITNFSEHFVREESNARSINPAAWKIDDAEITFLLYGEASNGEIYNDDFSSSISTIDSNGNFSINLPAYNWTLTLFACNNTPTSYTDALNKAALIARAHVDLTTSAMGVVFKLTSVGLTGKGTYNFDVKLDGWTIATNIETSLGIYDRITGEPIEGTVKTGSSISTALNDSGKYNFADESTGIDAGVYLFQVKFKNKDTGKVYVYGDTLNIVPYKTSKISETTADNYILIPNIIGTKPAAPEKAYAVYDTASLGTSQFPDYYTAAIIWEDKSNNERFFGLQLVELDLAQTTPNSSAWQNAPVYGENIIEQTTMYAGGSLLAGNNVILLRLPLGKRYAAQIWAENDAGRSDALPVKIATSTEVAQYKVDGLGGREGYFQSWNSVMPPNAPAATPTKGDSISLLRMTYRIQGGTYVPNDKTSGILWKKGDGTAGNATDHNAVRTIEATKNVSPSIYTGKSDLIVYYSKLSSTSDTTGCPLWKFADNALQGNGFPITSWYKNSTSGTALDAESGTYEKADNVVFYANYGLQGMIIAEDKTVLEPALSWLTITGPDETEKTISATKAVEIDDGATHKVVFKVEVPTTLDGKLGDDDKFDSIQVQVSKPGTTKTVYNETKTSELLAANGNPTEFLWNDISDGIYVITVTFKEGSEIRSIPDISLSVKQGTVAVSKVMLNTTSLSMPLGSTYTLIATIAPTIASDKSVNWTSSDTSKVTVTNGVLTAAAVGTATITVKSTDDDSKTATCDVTVVHVPVTSVSINESAQTIYQGGSFTFSSTYAPSNATSATTTWDLADISPSTDVANHKISVDPNTGEVTVAPNATPGAKANLTCTVETSDGTSKSASVQITVGTIPVTSVRISSATGNSVETGSTLQLTATVYPSSATNKTVTWTSSNTDKATVDTNGSVSGVAAGEVTITATTEDGSHTDTFTVTVTNP